MKLSGSYSSIARGVSQQVSAQRLDGQHAEQTNLVSDPVIGLVRRRGSEYRAHRHAPYGSTPGYSEYIKTLRNFDFRKTGVQYTLLYPTGQSPTVDSADLMCYNKETKTFLPIAPASQTVRELIHKGINKVTQVGDLLIMAVRGHATTYTGSGDLVAQSNAGVLWVRNGNYQRTYKLTVKMSNGSTIESSFTTPSASYPGTLDTSDIPYDSPNYTKLVNDRVNAYNSAVTAWMTTAAAQVQPAYIAQQLANQIATWTPSVSVFETNHVWFSHADIVSVSFTDGGDGTSVKSIWREVTRVEDLPYGAPDGKVVKVRPNSGDDAFYMKASVTNGGLGKAVWTEAAQTIVYPQFMFLMATVSAGTLVVAASPSELNSLTGMSVPNFTPRGAGDVNTAPMPNFLGKEITYLGNFQDRLVVVSGSVINMSRTGDYFNFFRTSVLTVKDDDPVEVYALGADDDIIRHSVFFDKSIVLFGERQQYTIDGRVPITPGTTTVIQSSAHEDATDAEPVSRGELVFFAKRREDLTKINQVEIGDVQDTSRVTEVSLQLYDYIGGRPVQLLAVTNPDMLLVRSTADYNSIVTFRYLDRGAERLLDSWSRWEYPAALGPVIGMTSYEDQIILFHYYTNPKLGKVFIVAASQSLLTQVDDNPYLDCMVRADLLGPEPFSNNTDLCIAVDSTQPKAYLQGERAAISPTVLPGHGPTYHVGLAKLQQDYPGLPSSSCWYGFEYPAFVELTSPYRRDQNGVAVTTGRLTISRVDLSYRDTAGLSARVRTERGIKNAVDFNGRLLGSASSQYPYNLATSSIPVFIGRESREYQLGIYAQDWRPFTLTAVEWTGQYFYNARR